MKKYRWLFFSTLLLTGACAQNKQSEMSDETAALADAGKVSEVQTQLAAIPQTDLYSDGATKLIKIANYRFQVESVKESTDAIVQAIRKYPAYISSSNLHLENPILENKMTIRVQNEYFQDLLKDIDSQAKFVNRRDVTTEDASKDFIDLESRLKSKREVEARYMEILRKKAGTIEELLETERQIGALHEEIEATVSRINYLRGQVTHSTINLEFYETIHQELHAGDEISTSDRFADAFLTGWSGGVNILIGLVYLWPLYILMACAFLIFRLKRPFKRTSSL